MAQAKNQPSNSSFAQLMGKVSTAMRKFLASRQFFAIVVAIIFLQGAWYALSISPNLYDESRHLGAISFNAELINPFVSQQDPKWDHLGDLVRDQSYLFYYVLSWPARLITHFTDSEFILTVSLRFIMLAVYMIGIYIYRKIFLMIGASAHLANLTFLLLALLPQLAILPGAIHYDSAVFTLFAIMLYCAIKVIDSKKPPPFLLLAIFSIGLTGSLIKQQFLALSVPLMLFTAFCLWRQHRERLWKLLKASFNSYTLAAQVVFIAVMLVSVGLFIERPVISIIKYQKISPQSSCEEILGSHERCVQNHTAERNAWLTANKPADFDPIPPQEFLISTWMPSMIRTLSYVTADPHSALFLPKNIFFAGALISITAILVNMNKILKNPKYRLLLAVAVAYLLTLLIMHYLLYVKLGAAVAVSGRYLLPVLPILIYLSLYSAATIIKNAGYKTSALPLLVIIIIVLMAQGAGASTALLTHKFYWENGPLNSLNQRMFDVAQPVVIESNPILKIKQKMQ